MVVGKTIYMVGERIKGRVYQFIRWVEGEQVVGKPRYKALIY